jgi:AcrR family transcriptional regulator
MPAKNKDRSSHALQQTRGRPPLDEVERKRILDATTAVFLEKGYARASTNEIALRAQTSKQTPYALFPTKADLFVGVISAHTEQLFARHLDYVESGKAPRQALTDMGERTLRMFSAPTFRALYRIVVAETHAFPYLARRLWEVCIERGYGLLAEYLRSRRLGGPAYRKSAAQFVTFVLGDFIVNAMLDPNLELSESVLRARVRDAVKDFLSLHPEKSSRK